VGIIGSTGKGGRDPYAVLPDLITSSEPQGKTPITTRRSKRGTSIQRSEKLYLRKKSRKRNLTFRGGGVKRGSKKKRGRRLKKGTGVWYLKVARCESGRSAIRGNYGGGKLHDSRDGGGE